MFQSSHRRIDANERPLCENCVENNNDCIFKPAGQMWMYVLEFCQRFKDKDKDKDKNREEGEEV